MNQIKSTDIICYNCKYSLWMVGIGQGLRCGLPSKEENKLPPLVPSRFHTCELIEFKKHI